jgi:hypothetical protein
MVAVYDERKVVLGISLQCLACALLGDDPLLWFGFFFFFFFFF